MYYSYVEIEYVATSFSPARKDLALKLLMTLYWQQIGTNNIQAKQTERLDHCQEQKYTSIDDKTIYLII